jgi:hypothetical protein
MKTKRKRQWLIEGRGVAVTLELVPSRMENYLKSSEFSVTVSIGLTYGLLTAIEAQSFA